MTEREKSVLYPGVTWKECIDFIETVDSFKLKTVSYLEVARKYGLKSPSTKSFTSRISASKQFGLTTTGNSTIQLTELARKILYPTDNNIKNVELECLVNPPLYEQLISIYNDKALPNVSILSNILMNNYKITRSAKDAAAKVFLETCEQLDLIRGGVLCYKLEDAESQETIETLNVEEEKTNVINEIPSIPSTYVGTPGEDNIHDYITQTYPVESGKAAKIVIPVDSTEDDLWAIRDMLDIIMKRKFKINL